MPEFHATVVVRIKGSILDPQGRALEQSLHRLGHPAVREVRVGKHIEFTLSGERADIERTVRRLAESILSNPVMEDADIALRELSPDAPQ
jgi:phosphoribosylformylglycinamidine synthase subunit PurS